MPCRDVPSSRGGMQTIHADSEGWMFFFFFFQEVCPPVVKQLLLIIKSHKLTISCAENKVSKFLIS